MCARGENIGADFLPSWDWVKVGRDKKDKVEADHYRRFWISASFSISKTSIGHSRPVVECLPDMETSRVASGHVNPCCILRLPSSLGSGYTVCECSTVHTTYRSHCHAAANSGCGPKYLSSYLRLLCYCYGRLCFSCT